MSAFVGRVAELGVIARALDGATDHQSRILHVIGEAGVGKSRLLEKAWELARARGYLIAGASAIDAERLLAWRQHGIFSKRSIWFPGEIRGE